MENKKMHIGKRIRLERIKLDLTREEVGAHIEANGQGVGYVERGVADSILIRYLRFLRESGTDLNEIFE